MAKTYINSKGERVYSSNRTSVKKQASLNRKPSQLKNRRESARKRYAASKSGKNISGKHWDHAVGRFVPQAANQGRKGEGNRKSTKRGKGRKS